MSATSLKSPARQPQTASVNPFAAALAETEKHSYSEPQPQASPVNPFSEALSRTGGALPNFDQAQSREKQAAEAREQQRKEVLRKRLHDQVNPVDTVDLFNAREKKVKEEIEAIRKELEFLIQDIKAVARGFDIEIQKAIVDPGFEGKYHISLFQKFRLFIHLLRQRVKSGGSWATMLNGKKGKKKRSGPGMEMGTGHEKTSTVHDMMHNERSSMYSGG